jgi:hypothetical protein
MKQSRLMSLVEAATNVVVGYGLAIATQIVVFPWFGLDQRSVCGVAGIGGTAREGPERRCHDRVGVMKIVAGATSPAHGRAVAPAYFGQFGDAGDAAQIVDITIGKPVWCDG